MATTFTTLWRLAILASGDQGTVNSWGVIQEAGQPLMEQGAVGTIAVNINGLTTFSLTTANNATDQARYLVQSYTGALVGDCTVTIPNLSKIGWAQNNTTGGHNVILSAGGLTAIIPPNGAQYFWVCDGSTNVSLISIGAGSLLVSGAVTSSGAITGTQFVPTGSGAPTVGTYLQAANALGFATATTLRATIDATGNFLVGTTDTAPITHGAIGTIIRPTGQMEINSTSASMNIGLTTAGGTLVEFFAGGPTNVGSISTAGAITNYNTTSDQRLKVKIGRIEYLEASDVIERIAALWFRWKDGNAEPTPGFFAQQAHRICPWAVTKGRGRPGTKNFRPWVMDASKLMPFVIVYIQGLGVRLTALERGR